MLKRSFAEFHAQRAQPELLAALERGQGALAALRARPWPASPLATSRSAPPQWRYCLLCVLHPCSAALLLRPLESHWGGLPPRYAASI